MENAKDIYPSLSLRDKRTVIQDLLNAAEYDSLGSLPGFTLVERLGQDGQENIDCFTYALRPEGGSVYTRLKKFYEEHNQVTTPVKGDLVLYLNEGKMTHIGFWAGDGKVLSKVGVAPVYLHPYREVPPTYLDQSEDIRFYRKNNLLSKIRSIWKKSAS